MNLRLEFQPGHNQANLKFEHFVNLAFDLFCTINPSGYFEWLNPLWEKTFRVSATTLLTHPWIELVHPSDRPQTLAEFATLFAQSPQGVDAPSTPVLPPTVSFQNRCCYADGAVGWFHWNATYDAEQDRIYAVVRPTREPSAANPTVLDSKTLFHHLVENVKDYAIYMLNPEGQIISWNLGAERINGYREADILGQPVARLYRSDDVAAGKPEQELQIALSQGRFEDESWRVRQDGTEFCVHAVITPVWDDDGQLRGFTKVVRDVTECHMADLALQQAYSELERRVEERTEELWRKNEQLEHAHEELQQLNHELIAQAQDLSQTMRNLKQTQVQLIQSEKMSSLGQLVAGVAHEINNPVNFIYGNISYASQYIEDILRLLTLYQQRYGHADPILRTHVEAIDLDFVVADLPKLLNSMKLGADRIRQIVLSLRNFSRLNESDKKSVDIHEGIDSTLLILQNRIKATPNHGGITIIKDYANLPLIECYPGQLNQVFMNILSNAIDAIDSRIEADQKTASTSSFTPTIHIFTEQTQPHWVTIRIADNGSGIPDAVKQRLFDPFFTTKPIGKGTGLGLSICYQIVVEKHRGHLMCHSAPGQGTEFIIEIPIKTG